MVGAVLFVRREKDRQATAGAATSEPPLRM